MRSAGKPTPFGIRKSKSNVSKSCSRWMERSIHSTGRYQLLHYSKSERRTEHKDGLLSYEPSVALEFADGSVQPIM
jgi:hypothetical protein